MTIYDLDSIAGVLKLHPKSVLMNLEPGTKTWYAGIDKKFDYETVYLVYGLRENTFRRCLEGKDELIDANELSVLLDVPPSVVRSRAYPVAIRNGRNLRYLKSKAMLFHVERYSHRQPNRKGLGPRGQPS